MALLVKSSAATGAARANPTRAEAAAKRISVEHHATHLIVHGTLHLLGHEHDDDAAAEAMEEIERVALASLGIADPYAHDED